MIVAQFGRHRNGPAERAHGRQSGEDGTAGLRAAPRAGQGRLRQGVPGAQSHRQGLRQDIRHEGAAQGLDRAQPEGHRPHQGREEHPRGSQGMIHV